MAKQVTQLDLDPELTKRALEQSLASAKRMLMKNQNETVRQAIQDDITKLQIAINTLTPRK